MRGRGAAIMVRGSIILVILFLIILRIISLFLGSRLLLRVTLSNSRCSTAGAASGEVALTAIRHHHSPVLSLASGLP
jgi:hypothetical protein